MTSIVTSLRGRWVFSILVTNLAVGVVLLILAGAGQLPTVRAFLDTAAYTLVFANLTSVFGLLVIGPALEKRARRKQRILPAGIAGIAAIVLIGCLAGQAGLVLLHLAPPRNFWAQYLHTLKVAVPLALVFGLGAMAYASLRGRLEVAEILLQHKELAEERTRKLAAEARLRSLESWIHPHFLFNTLNSISALISTNPALAEQTVGRLATLLRASLDSSSHSLIPLRQELALVESYMDIERVRFGPRLRGRVDVPAELLEVSVPPMSIQSLAENAIKHGITPLPGGGEFVITARAENSSVRIAVRDSGPGFDLASIPADHGLDKLVQRLDALYGPGAHLSVTREDGFSVVEMVLPAQGTLR